MTNVMIIGQKLPFDHLCDLAKKAKATNIRYAITFDIDNNDNVEVFLLMYEDKARYNHIFTKETVCNPVYVNEIIERAQQTIMKLNKSMENVK